jgi:hypothetical protein
MFLLFFIWGPGPGIYVKIGPLNSHLATKVQPDRRPLRPRRQIATQGHCEDMPRRSGRLPLPGAAARSKKPTVAPHTFRVRYLNEDSINSELASEMASWQPRLVALKRACKMIWVNKFAQEFWIWGGSLGTVEEGFEGLGHTCFRATGRQPCVNVWPPSSLVYRRMPWNVVSSSMDRLLPWMSVGHAFAYAR